MLQAEVEVTGVDENVRTPEVTVPCYVIHVSAQQHRPLRGEGIMLAATVQVYLPPPPPERIVTRFRLSPNTPSLCLHNHTERELAKRSRFCKHCHLDTMFLV